MIEFKGELEDLLKLIGKQTVSPQHHWCHSGGKR
jgi:hypothetical protein